MDKASALLLLGLQDGDLTRASLKAAYRAAVQINHPDRHQGNEKLRKHAEEQCRRINEARDVLERYLDREERCGRVDARAAGAGAGSDGRSRANDKAAGPQRTATESAKEKPSSASSDSSKRASGASKESRAASGSTARQAPNQSSGAGASAGATPKESRGAQSRAVEAQRESRIAWNVRAVIAVMAFLVASAPVPSGAWEDEVASMKGHGAETAQCVYVARQDDLAVIAVRKGTKEDFFCCACWGFGRRDPWGCGLCRSDGVWQPSLRGPSQAMYLSATPNIRNVSSVHSRRWRLGKGCLARGVFRRGIYERELLFLDAFPGRARGK